jgi:hypothetical protein
MNILAFPTQNPLLNTFLRSIVIVITMVFGLKTTFYSAYWAAIIHDTISLTLLWQNI